MSENEETNLDELTKLVSSLPMSHRVRWIAGYLKVSPDQPIDLILSDFWKTANSIQKAALEELIRQLLTATREANRIRRRLQSLRYEHNEYWKDVLLESLYDTALIQNIEAHILPGANKDPEFIRWLERIFDETSVPDLLDITPPLSVYELSELRRATDRKVKRFIRRKDNYCYDARLIKENKSKFETPCDYPILEERDALDFAMKSLTDAQKKVVKRYFLEGVSMEDIGKEMKISKASAYRLVNSALLSLNWALSRNKRK